MGSSYTPQSGISYVLNKSPQLGAVGAHHKQQHQNSATTLQHRRTSLAKGSPSIDNYGSNICSIIRQHHYQENIGTNQISHSFIMEECDGANYSGNGNYQDDAQRYGNKGHY